MSEIEKEDPPIGRDINDYLTEEERKKLLASLHHVLVWVGVKEPEELQIDGDDLKSEMDKFHQTEKDLPPEIHAEQGRVDLHHLIWRLINEKEITEKERMQIAELIEILEKKEKVDEESLKAAKLTQKRAIELHDEAASIIRALLDLKDLLKKRERGIETEDAAEDLIRRKVKEAKRWNKFMNQIKKDEG
jgi:myosin heavy subunit